ncbi:hypothetical protein [uncultured Campylobacter sp.]|uniref:hypothetical protein n=1 Tax=uncultured Campylobacter sp. TaxID=218934 RepID=UPI00260C627B|nr:hypothetical protein [uncultured Campylobacter sp.]
MRVFKILSQYRRDFRAVFECEHCGFKIEKTGYDDTNFHRNVIPDMRCEKCGKKADQNYRPLEPKYPDGFQI